MQYLKDNYLALPMSPDSFRHLKIKRWIDTGAYNLVEEKYKQWTKINFDKRNNQRHS